MGSAGDTPRFRDFNKALFAIGLILPMKRKGLNITRGKTDV